MDLKNILADYPGINITITADELKKYSMEIATTVAETIVNRKPEKLYSAHEVEQIFNICPATRWRWDKM